MRFSEIHGNDEIKVRLAGTVASQRVSHAQMFHGPAGSEKLALAIAYAQLINCTGRTRKEAGLFGEEPEAGPATDSCGTCPSCLKFAKLAHPDLHFIYPVAGTKTVSKPRSKYFAEEWREFLLTNRCKGSLQEWHQVIGIENKQGIINADDCNEIITTLSYKSYESEYKVMVLWMVERLFHAAAPKILKILEEPPEKTLFLLITEDPGQVLPTIRSRTLMVRIPASVDTLESRPEEEQDFDTFRAWMRLCYGRKIPELVKFSGEIARTGRENQKAFLGYALRMTGICNSLNFNPSMPTGLDGEQQEFLVKFAPFITGDLVPPLNTMLNDAIFHIERNAYPSVLFLDMSLSIMKLFHPGFLPPR